MSAEMRDERVKVFGYLSTDADGRDTASYPFQGQYWSRRGVPTGREVSIAEQASHRVDAVFAFSGGVNIPGEGALRHQDGTIYKITAVLPVRGTSTHQEQIVFAAYSDEQLLTVTGEP